MEARPKIKILLTSTDKMLEVLGWFTVLLLWILVIVNYAKLPETIPTHYNGVGSVDGYGAKGSILILPIVGTCIFVGLTYLNKFPEVFNYAIRITKENAEKQYTNATRMIRYLKLMTGIVFLFINYQTIHVAIGKSNGLSSWFLPLVLIMFGVFPAYFIIKSIRYK